MRNTLVFLALLFVVGCASTPKTNQEKISIVEAQAWLTRYCSKPIDHEMAGSLVMKANTKEIKGQYPASLHFDANGPFQLEVTNIIGGTMVSIQGDPTQISIQVPSKPKFNRAGVTSYMGIETPILRQLLHGDLPCPTADFRKKMTVEGSKIVLSSENWKWNFERSTPESGDVPVKVTLVSPAGEPDSGIEMTVEDWDRTKNYAKKVAVKTPEGELKWSWRSRE